MKTKLIRESQFTDRCNVSNCPNSATHEVTTDVGCDPHTGEPIYIKPVRVCEEHYLELENDPTGVVEVSQNGEDAKAR